MEQTFFFVEPDPAVLWEDDIPEVEDLFHLKAEVDMRDDFLDKGRQILFGLVLGGGLFREKFVVHLDEIVKIGFFNGLGEPINGLLPCNSCHDRSPAPVCGMAKPRRSTIAETPCLQLVDLPPTLSSSTHEIPYRAKARNAPSCRIGRGTAL